MSIGLCRCSAFVPLSPLVITMPKLRKCLWQHAPGSFDEVFVQSDDRSKLLLLSSTANIELMASDPISALTNVNTPPLSVSAPFHDRRSNIKSLLVTSCSGLLIASLLLMSLTRPGCWRYYMAGGICAAFSHAVPVPIDVVKTRQQVDPQFESRQFWCVLKRIYQTEGLPALWVGLGPTTWGYLLEGAMKFGVYEVLKPRMFEIVTAVARLHPSLSAVKSSTLSFVLCGAVAGLVASIMICPMEALRIRMLSEPQTYNPRDGVWRSARAMVRREGFNAWWKGLLPMISKQVPYTVTKNVAFDIFTRFSYGAVSRRVAGPIPSTAKIAVPFVSAFAASMLSCVASQPGDMLVSLVNAHEDDSTVPSLVVTRHGSQGAPKLSPTRKAMQTILSSDKGVRGLFVGLKTRLLHVGIIVTLQLLVYDFVKRLVGIAATGTE
jgi:solute carrier family 25 (mitochondrial phosphate transporter), member 3